MKFAMKLPMKLQWFLSIRHRLVVMLILMSGATLLFMMAHHYRLETVSRDLHKISESNLEEVVLSVRMKADLAVLETALHQCAMAVREGYGAGSPKRGWGFAIPVVENL